MMDSIGGYGRGDSCGRPETSISPGNSIGNTGEYGRGDSCGRPGSASNTVAVVGLGKIGLPLAVQYAMHGWRVIGCDINPQVVAAVNAGQSHVQEETELAFEVPRLVKEGLLSATMDTTEAVRRSRVIVVIVPVVVDVQHDVYFAAIDTATTAIGAGLQPGSLVIYETTLPVGTTSGRFRGMLERISGLQTGKDFYLAYSPERVASGQIFHGLRTYPKVVGGIDPASLAAAEAFYRSVLEAEIITMASAEDAEFVKLIETTYRDVNIALANEFACYAGMQGLNVTAAIAAANTQPYAHIHNPGIGVGGHCIPVYPYFLFNGVEGAELYTLNNAPLQMLLLPRYARQINDAMAEYAVRMVEETLNSLVGQSVLILGAAYRGDVRETAYTSTRFIQDALMRHGANVYVDDPLFDVDELHSQGFTPFREGLEDEIRAIMLQANHQAYQTFDFSRFPHCQVVFDGRNALVRASIEALGMRYLTVGSSDSKKVKRVESSFSLISSTSLAGGFR
ncbi:MAG TPA: nucleotide sugar dehydrogenase [Ktedonobacteraceae bacterium]|nr:nucleotide sugar dehydrogenase [Ktedonobacteraceae bacterium]